MSSADLSMRRVLSVYCGVPTVRGASAFYVPSCTPRPRPLWMSFGAWLGPVFVC